MRRTLLTTVAVLAFAGQALAQTPLAPVSSQAQRPVPTPAPSPSPAGNDQRADPLSPQKVSRSPGRPSRRPATKT